VWRRPLVGGGRLPEKNGDGLVALMEPHYKCCRPSSTEYPAGFQNPCHTTERHLTRHTVTLQAEVSRGRVVDGTRPLPAAAKRPRYSP
jgi:hypothetical protein